MVESAPEDTRRRSAADGEADAAPLRGAVPRAPPPAAAAAEDLVQREGGLIHCFGLGGEPTGREQLPHQALAVRCHGGELA